MRDEQSDLWISACSSRFKAAGLQLGLDNIACYRAPSCTILIFGLTPLVGSAGPLGPPFHRSEGVKVTE